MESKQTVIFNPEEFKHSRKKRVMLVIPPGSIEINFGRLSAAGAELPWLGMAHVAAAVRSAGHQIFLRDYDVEGKSWPDLQKDIASFQPDVIATAGFINNMDRCLKVFETAKAVNPKIITVLGGPQASIFPHDAIQSPHLDFVSISESEISFSRLVSNVEDPQAWPTFKGMLYRDPKTGNIVKNDRQPLITDLDSVPRPALDLYPMDQYYPAVYIWGKRIGTLVTSRGCPFDCTFCEAKLTYGRTVRNHSVERILEDLDFFHKNYGYDSFQFYDDNFTCNRKRVVQVCEALLKKNRKYHWMCYSRTDHMDLEVCKLMKRAGCYMISFGVEAADQCLLDKIKKKLTVETNWKGIEVCSKAGILTIGTFMLGLPTETREHSLHTIDFACKSKLDYVIFGITEPYPGTEMWNDALTDGYFIDVDETHTNHLLPNFNKIWVPNGRVRDDLEALSRLGYWKFYLRPKIFVRWLTNFRHIPFGRSFRYLLAGFEYLIYYPVKDALSRIFRKILSACFPKDKNQKDKDPSGRHFGTKYG